MRSAIVDLVAAISAGARRTGRYRGLFVATYAVQLAVSLIPATLVFGALAAKLGAEPALDRAVDGDLAAAVEAVRAVPDLPLVAVVGVGLAALAYVAISWFLCAGLLGVYRERPEGGEATARCFGAFGARRFFAFVRLFVMTAPLYAVIAVWATLALSGLIDRLTEIATPGDLAGAALAHLGGPAALLWIVTTAVAHARVELIADTAMPARRAVIAGVVRVVSRPVCLLHTGAGHLAALALAALFFALGGLGVGVAGAVLARQLHTLGRHAVHLTILAGQSELGDRLRRRSS